MVQQNQNRKCNLATKFAECMKRECLFRNQSFCIHHTDQPCRLLSHNNRASDCFSNSIANSGQLCTHPLSKLQNLEESGNLFLYKKVSNFHTVSKRVRRSHDKRQEHDNFEKQYFLQGFNRMQIKYIK
eukprot:Pompholyxophrys_sp_v1_NODE_188_length_1286_cov_1.308692.p2 type:complete len:128 gc:universal NODE_188_length_1286_cov_1.308692:575-192(-)